MIHFSHFTTAVQLLQQYKGEQPFDSFSKDFFRQHKKYGSKDRKNILQFCYAYFRMGKALTGISIEEKIKAGLFLCSTEPNALLEFVQPEWNEQAVLPLGEKLAVAHANGWQLLASVFPWKEELSEGIEHEKLCLSFFTQPNLFLRLRPGKEKIVKQKLEKAGIPFTEINSTCLSLPNASAITDIIELNAEAVIQDYNSQQTGCLLESQIRNRGSEILTVWDCCAGSGGKSILAVDVLHPAKLTVSDVRPAILANLSKRFEAAGIKNYTSFVTDLMQPARHSPPIMHDLIIADVPCTGSGTWARTPEQLAFFDEKEIDRYSEIQRKITGNAVPHIQKGGYLLYITCSVFKKENEEMVTYIRQKLGLQLLKMQLLKGYEQKADTLFAALFTDSND